MATAQPFTAFVSPAKRYPQLWRLLVGTLLCVVVMVLWLGATFGGLVVAMGIDRAMALLAGLESADRPSVTFLLLSTFFGMFAAPMIAAKILHGRSPATLFGPSSKVLRHFAIATVVSALIYGITLLIWRLNFSPVVNLPTTLWLTLLPLSLLFVLIQTGAEELVFRGYLMQQLAARFGSPLIHMLVPSLLFGILHFDPVTMGTNAWAVVGSTAFFGLLAADLTVATGTIGAAWGLHFANNVVALLIISTKGTITGLALYVTPYTANEVEITGPLLMADLTLLIVVWGVLRLSLRR